MLHELVTARSESNGPGCFDVLGSLAEISFGCETPIKRAHHPLGQSFRKYPNIVINLGPPRRKMAADVIETVDGSHAQVANKVNGRLKVNVLLPHDDYDHVMIVTMRLLNVVRI